MRGEQIALCSALQIFAVTSRSSRRVQIAWGVLDGLVAGQFFRFLSANADDSVQCLHAVRAFCRASFLPNSDIQRHMRHSLAHPVPALRKSIISRKVTIECRQSCRCRSPRLIRGRGKDAVVRAVWRRHMAIA
ncbi:hypothetical protein EV356DRAFT_502112 [Viridothelium virens]|uniref:Uncharacterized protein n=1 Tax=Viridothelium virens TaxID=1048519 RepID=A0A6A6HM11_VIRVR|nr:hypothetical protein EV356DRAFT_502112 [Viridothelium virens]